MPRTPHIPAPTPRPQLSSSTMWVSETGHKVDYGSLGADLHDALLPGEWLFEKGTMEEDGDPDERMYEGYTGNSGPTLEYVYHRAVVVLWPRARKWRVALAGGLGTALDLLDRRMVEVATRGVAAAAGGQAGQQGGAGGGSAAMQETLRLLRGVTGLVVKGPNKSPSYSYGWSGCGGTSTSYDSLVARALRLAASPVGCGVAAAAGGSGAAVAARIVGGLERNGVGLGSGAKSAIVDALAAVSASLSSPAFDEAVVHLVRAAGTRHVAQVAALVRSPAAGLNLRLRVVDALCNAAMADGNTFAAIKQEDVLALARLLYGVYDSAAASLPAVGISRGGAAALAAGADPARRAQMLHDLQTAVRYPERFASRFSELVAARPDAEGLQKALLAEGAVRCAVQGGHPAALGLVAPRLRALQAIRAAGRPVFAGWEQPGARFPSDQKVGFVAGSRWRRSYPGTST